MGVVFYRVALAAELGGLRDRLLATAITLSMMLDAEGLDHVRGPEDVDHPAFRDALRRFEQICAHYPRIHAIYVMRPTSDPLVLETIVDYTRSEVEVAPPGEPYDTTPVPVMRQGLLAPAVEQEPFRDEWGLTISGYAPLATASGRPVGLVGLDFDARRVDEIRLEVLETTLVAFGLAGLLMVGLGVLVARNLKRPLSVVMTASEEVASGKLDTRVSVAREDEFGLLGDNFNRMAEGLQEREFIRDTFGRYMSEEVARSLLSRPELLALGGEEREVTVLFSDLRGYSSVSERLRPTEVVALLNEYLGAMNEIIEAHRGCVIEYLGDAILAVFGAPNELPEHATAAVRCAAAMRERLVELNRGGEARGVAAQWQALGFEQLAARVGIHTGRVVAGNLGSKTRMKYAVTGDTVNVAARLEQLNKQLGTEILFSGDVRERLAEDVRELTVERGSHLVKGRDGEVATWSI
jgi:adenylate cyclase